MGTQMRYKCLHASSSTYVVQETLTRRIWNVQSDSIVALDLDTGGVKWSTRLGPLDVWLGKPLAARQVFDDHFGMVAVVIAGNDPSFEIRSWVVE